MRTLCIAAGVETTSLVVLVANLLTAHAPAVATVVGPIHGSAYAVVIVAAALVPAAASSTRWRAAVPGIGGLLALRHLRDSEGI